MARSLKTINFDEDDASIDLVEQMYGKDKHNKYLEMALGAVRPPENTLPTENVGSVLTVCPFSEERPSSETGIQNKR